MANNDTSPSGNEHSSPNQDQGTEKKEEKKQIGTLESVVNESAHATGNFVKLGLAGLIPYSLASAVPSWSIDTAVQAGAQVAGDATTSRKKGKKFTATNVLEASILGTALTPPLEVVLGTINKIPLDSLSGYLGRAALWGGVGYPFFVGLYQFLDYTIKNRKIKGVFDYMKKEYWPALKGIYKILPISLLNIFFAPPYLQIPIGAALTYIFTLFGAPKRQELKEEEKRDKTPYLSAASSALGKGLKTIFYGVPQAVYAIGSGIKDTLYRAAPKPAAPAAAPAH